MEKLKQIKEIIFLFWKTFPIFWEASKLYTLGLVIIIPLQGILPAANIWLSQAILNEVIQLSEWSFQSRIFSLLVGWIMVALISSLLSPIEMTVQGLMTDKLIATINLKIMRKSSDLKGLTYFEDPSFHNDIQVIEQEAAWRPTNLMVFIASVIKSTITAISMLSLLLTFHIMISTIVLLSVLPQAIVTYRLQKEAFETLVMTSPESRKLRYYSSVLLDRKQAQEVRLFNLGDYFINQYTLTFKSIHEKIRKVRYKQAFYSIILVSIGMIGTGGSFYWVINEAIYGQVSPGDILIFASSIIMARQSVEGIIENSGMLYDTLLYMKKLFSFLSLPSSIIDGEREIGQMDHWTIEFKDVSFKYPNTDTFILKNISFKIHSGDKIALVGENGAGKTTIVKLLLRLYDPDSGEILLNDRPVSEYKVNRYREFISVVFQDYAKYQLTIRENIGLSKQEKMNDETRLFKVIDNVGLRSIVESLPHQLNQILSKNFDGGTEFSGGQWQKIAIARSEFRNAPLLILDEPSASLDARSEEELLNSFQNLSKDKTLILITHKLSALNLIDKTIVLKNGEIVEKGNHVSLMKKNGLYSELYNLQAKRYSSS